MNKMPNLFCIEVLIFKIMFLTLQGCKYLTGPKVVFTSLTILLTNSLLSSTVGVCTEIIGGREVKPNSRPFMVSIQLNEQHICGGALIAPRWVLTAAHCQELYQMEHSKVVLGAHSLSKTQKGKKTIKVIKTFPHPMFDERTPENDIMLLQLAQEAILNKHVSTLKLPKSTEDVKAGTKCRVAGWGTTNPEILKASDTLREVNVNIIDRKVCNSKAYYDYNPIITKDMLCAGDNKARKDTCAGDSGGPLLCMMKAKKYMYKGIVSGGTDCGVPTRPGIYTRLSEKYLNWITKIIRIKNHNITKDQISYLHAEEIYQNGTKDEGLQLSSLVFALEQRRLNEDLIEVFKIMSDFERIKNIITRSSPTYGPMKMLFPALFSSATIIFFLLPGYNCVKIIGGQEVVPHSKPYMVSIQFQNKHKCGGALIKTSWVLTAAHCQSKLKNTRVVLGAHSLSNEGDGKQIFAVKRMIPHSLYNSKLNTNDIMLLQLNDTATLNKFVNVLNLPNSEMDIKDGAMCNVTGWGFTRFRNGKISDKLQQVNVTIIDRNLCSEYYAYHPAITKDVLCAGDKKGARDSCYGDSGGPLLCNGKFNGIVSFGCKCGEPRKPGVYTRLSNKYLSWIKKTI
uniref:transmembrane protease serine 9-like n=1 Tax=Pristiophorus japonicus TaxID=55135 RepID=UPI00398F6AD9